MSSCLRALLGASLTLAQIACAFDTGGAGSGATGVGGSSGGVGETSTGGGTSGPDDAGAVTSAAGQESSTVAPTTAPGDVSGDDANASTTTAVGETGAATTASTSDGGVEASTGASWMPEHYGPCSDDMCGPDALCITLYIDDVTTGSVCYLPCNGGCPEASGGTAEPICTDSGCALDCVDATCPDGMVCAWTEENNRRCVWP